MARRLLCFLSIVISFYSFQLKAHPVEKLDSVQLNLSSVNSLNSSFYIAPKTTLYISFNLGNELNKNGTYIIKSSRIEIGKLYLIKGSKPILLGQTGVRIAIKDRSIASDNSAIKFKVAGIETLEMMLVFDNFNEKEKLVKVQLLNNEEYQSLSELKDSSFYEKYWKNIFFGMLILALILSAFQYLILPEKSLIYYFLYVFFSVIRSLSANENLILEDIFPFLGRIGYHSLYSQVFTYISFIFYILFIREFTGFYNKRPREDWWFKFHISFLMVFMIFDLIFPTEKYFNTSINHVFRSFETLGLLIGLYSLFLITRVYDTFNKYIIIGAFSLVIIAIFGQEIIKRTIDETQNLETYKTSLSILWSIAYAVEIAFFTLALINRQRILLKTLSIAKEQPQIVNENLLENKTTEMALKNDSFTLATNRGVLVFQQSDIVRLEASGNYTIFSIQNQKQTLGSYTLSDFESKLNPSKFLRVHKSHVVNLDYILKYTKGDGGSLTLQDGSVIPVSRSRKDELIKRLNFS